MTDTDDAKVRGRRLVITLTVPCGDTPDGPIDAHDIADELRLIGRDPTVWEWGYFWSDVRDGLVTAERDDTVTEYGVCYGHPITHHTESGITP
jgi:hypothetical protein